MNLAYYSAYNLQVRKDQSHSICRFTREKEGSSEVEVIIAFIQELCKLLRALGAVELNSYIAILAPPKHKKSTYSSGVKGFFFLPSLLQCTATDIVAEI